MSNSPLSVYVFFLLHYILRELTYIQLMQMYIDTSQAPRAGYPRTTRGLAISDQPSYEHL